MVSIRPLPLPLLTIPIVAVTEAPTTVDGNPIVLPVSIVTTFPSVGKEYVTTRLGTVPFNVNPIVPFVDGDWGVAPFSVYGILSCPVAWVAAAAMNWTAMGSESLGLSVAGKAVVGVKAKLFSPYICGTPTVALVSPW